MTFFTLDDHEIPEDTRDVLAASAALQITEFRLFELAHERWFGQPAGAEEVEAAFTPYMFHHRVPHWVRQFAREVRDADRAGRLVPADFGVGPRDDRYARYSIALRVSLIATLVIVTLSAVGMLVGHYSGMEGGPA